MLIFRDCSVILIPFQHQHPSHTELLPQVPPNCMVIVQGQETSVHHGLPSSPKDIASVWGCLNWTWEARWGGNPVAMLVNTLFFSLGARNMCEELWPPLPHPCGQPRFHRQCSGENHLSQEQPSHHCAGQGTRSDPGRLSPLVQVVGMRWGL